MLKRILFIGLIAVLGCSLPKSDIDTIELTQLDGTKIQWTELKGKRVFVNFWATWCKPCIQEMPTIAKAQAELQDSPIVFLFASNESIDLIEGFKAKRPFNFHYVQAQNMEALNIQALPTTFIFDENGKLVFSEAGYRDWSTTENLTLISGSNN